VDKLSKTAALRRAAAAGIAQDNGKVELIDALIANLQSCERALTPAHAGGHAELIFVDDFSRYVDDLRNHAEALTTSPFYDLAARYNATLKLAVMILLRIRELQVKGGPTGVRQSHRSRR